MKPLNPKYTPPPHKQATQTTDETTEQLKVALLLTINELRVKIKVAQDRQDIRGYVEYIERLTKAYKELIP